jgi:hypothetical protein
MPTGGLLMSAIIYAPTYGRKPWKSAYMDAVVKEA